MAQNPNQGLRHGGAIKAVSESLESVSTEVFTIYDLTADWTMVKKVLCTCE